MSNGNGHRSTGNSLGSVLLAVEAGLGWLALPVSTVIAHAVCASLLFALEPPLVVSIYAWDGKGAIGELVAAMSEVMYNRPGGQITERS